MKIRPFRAFAALSIVSAFIGMWPAAAATADNLMLTYSVKEARAYGYKVSLSPEEIAATKTQNTLRNQCAAKFPGQEENCYKIPPTCDPATDAYQCDHNKYNHTPNCPAPIPIGPNAALSDPQPPPGEMQSGGADYETDDKPEGPPQGSPVRLDELLSLATLGHSSYVQAASGLGSDVYVDLDGRQNGNAHTESDAFTPGRALYEERCWSGNKDGSISTTNYSHQLSRSRIQPGTYHLAECYESQCTFGGISIRASAHHAISISTVYESGGKVIGKMSSVISGLDYGSGQLTVDSLNTFVSFESDGTKAGLKWSATTAASGGRLGGQPVPLKQGQVDHYCSPVQSPSTDPVPPPPTIQCIYYGVAAPYVKTTEDGKQLTMIAPGMFVGSEAESGYFAGAEVYASMDRIPPPPPLPNFSDIQTYTVGGGSVFIPGEQTGLTGPPPAPVRPADVSGKRIVSIKQISTGPYPVASIIGSGLILLIMVLALWMQRYEWVRRLYRHQPFRMFDWMYRAFVRT